MLDLSYTELNKQPALWVHKQLMLVSAKIKAENKRMEEAKARSSLK